MCAPAVTIKSAEIVKYNGNEGRVMEFSAECYAGTVGSNMDSQELCEYTRWETMKDPENPAGEHPYLLYCYKRSN